MKKIHLFIIGLLACMTFFDGCQKFENLDSQDGLTGYEFQIYRQNDISRKYRITYNDREVLMTYRDFTSSNSINFTHLPSDTIGVVKIYNGNTTEPEFSRTMTLKRGESLRFIQLYNDPIMVYNEADFTYFYLSIAYQATAGNTYTATFQDTPISLVSYNSFLIQRSKLTGTLKLYKNGGTTPVYSGTITIVPEKKFYLVQLPNKELGPIDNTGEANPSTPNSVKIRFTGLKTSDLGADSVRMDVYTAPNSLATNYASYEFLKSVVVKVGELSPYVEFNLAKYGNTDYDTQALFAAYKLYDAKTGAPIVETLSKARIMNSAFEPFENNLFVSKNKFMTSKIFIMGTNYKVNKLFVTER